MNLSGRLAAALICVWTGHAAAQDLASLPGIEPLTPPQATKPAPGWQGPMTYVQQSHGTCWAATALMLVRAYGGTASLFDLIGAMGEWVNADDDGGGAYGLANTAEAYSRLVEVMNSVTPGQPFVLRPTPYNRWFEGVISSAVDNTRMSDVLAQWQPAAQNGLPFIHASARHAWLVLRPDPSAVVPTWYVHDPKGGAFAGAREPGRGNENSEGGPYWIVAQDWLELVMRAKNRGYAYVAQVVQPTRPPPAGMPLQSLAVPFIGANGDRQQGHFCFSRRPDLQRCMAWKPMDTTIPTPYAWQPCGAQKCVGKLSMKIEAWLDDLQLTLPVWNADITPQRVEIRAALNYGGGQPGPTASLRAASLISIPAGKSQDWSAKLTNVCALRQTDRDVDAVLDIEVWHAARRIDHLPVRVVLAPRPHIDRITPAQPRPGDHVTIEGSGFGAMNAAHAVDVDGSVAGVEAWSDRAIEVILPATSSSGGTLRVAPFGSTCAATLSMATAPAQYDCAKLLQENPMMCLFEGSNEFYACCGVDPGLPPGTTKDD
ncbi:MAG: IPT/TIG domain-containing protein [Lysobacterales bacterium]